MYKLNKNRPINYLLVFKYCILISLITNCDAREGNRNMERHCDFFNIEINVKKRTACSPVVDDDFRGIKIAAPERIELNEDVPFVLCGTMKLNRRYEFLFRSVVNEWTIVIENFSAKKVWSCNLLKPGYKPPPKNPRVTIDRIHPEEVATSWFNIDLFRYIPDMPHLPGEYVIYSTLGDYTSNSVIVKLEEK